MLSRAACVLAEWILAVHGTWCPSGLGSSLHCHWGRPADRSRGWDHSCTLAPVPVHCLPSKHSGSNAFFSPSKHFLEEILQVTHFYRVLQRKGSPRASIQACW